MDACMEESGYDHGALVQLRSWCRSSGPFGHFWMSGPGAFWPPTKLSAWVMAEYQWSTVLVACPGRPSPRALAKSKRETLLWQDAFVARVQDARISPYRI